MNETRDVKAKSKHTPNYRCAFCHEAVEDEIQAPCGGCGTLLHPECKVQAQGCPTLGCEHHGPRSHAAARPRRPRASAATRIEVAGWGGLGVGAAGMVLSFLALASGMNPLVLAGMAGFVAGAVLVTAGTIVLAMAARRGGRSIAAGADRRATATIMSRLVGLAGAAGMMMSFLALAGTHVHELMAGGAGFVAGAVLLLSSLVSYALLVEDDDEAGA